MTGEGESVARYVTLPIRPPPLSRMVFDQIVIPLNGAWKGPGAAYTTDVVVFSVWRSVKFPSANIFASSGGWK